MPSWNANPPPSGRAYNLCFRAAPQSRRHGRIWDMEMRVLVFGDSVVLGTWDSLGGWVDRLKQHYHKRYIESGGEEKVQIYNLGIGGEGSQKLLFRIENEIQARWDDRWPTAIVIATGTNDSRLLHGTTLQATEDQFRKNLRDILEKCKSYTAASHNLRYLWGHERQARTIWRGWGTS